MLKNKVMSVSIPEGVKYMTNGGFTYYQSCPMDQFDKYAIQLSEIDFVKSQIEGKILTLMEALLVEPERRDASKSLVRNIVNESFQKMGMMRLIRE